MMSLAAQGNTEQARNILKGECEEFYNALHTSLGNIIAYNTEGSEEATQESISLYRIALLAQGAVMAVVADEVRNLANKSAEASHASTALIDESIQAVDIGTQVAAETAKSLMGAVESVNAMHDVIGQISEASSTQAEAISQISAGIDQISAVVQTNSATAEESAAASRELTGQSQMMKKLAEQFRLK